MKLSINIPTRSRDKALCELLRQLMPQVAQRKWEVQVTVLDNASQDETPAVCRLFDVNYQRHPENIGAHANQLAAASIGSDWRWVLCDDEIITNDAVERWLNVINTYGQSTDLIISRLSRRDVHPCMIGGPHKLEYFISLAASRNPAYLLPTGGWSQCLFRRIDIQLFNDLAATGWSYPHHPAILAGVEHVYLYHSWLVHGRPTILPPPDNLVSLLPSSVQWEYCVEWLNNRFNMSMPADILTNAYTAEQLGELARNPIKCLWRYRKQLLVKDNLRRGLNRMASLLRAILSGR